MALDCCRRNEPTFAHLVNTVDEDSSPSCCFLSFFLHIFISLLFVLFSVQRLGIRFHAEQKQLNALVLTFIFNCKL